MKRPPAAASPARAATCRATSHRAPEGGVKRILVQHNQNDNLRPNEKMIRPVCMNCHGLGYSIDALADAELVARQLPRPAALHVQSLEMVGKAR